MRNSNPNIPNSLEQLAKNSRDQSKDPKPNKLDNLMNLINPYKKPPYKDMKNKLFENVEQESKNNFRIKEPPLIQEDNIDYNQEY